MLYEGSCQCGRIASQDEGHYAGVRAPDAAAWC
jgi:hypothetical protein